MALKDYIAETLEELHKQQTVDYNLEADKILERLIDPNYEPRKVTAPKKLTTRVESFKHFQETYSGVVFQAVYATVASSDEPLSRQEVAERLGIKVSTVCARVAELMEAGAVSVEGYKIDLDTNRRVETLISNLGDTDVK